MLTIPWGISDTDRQNSHSFVHSSYFLQISLLVRLPESSGGRVRAYPQPASSSPWLSMLTYHLGGKQQAGLWPQFWDIVSPHHNQSINQSMESHGGRLLTGKTEELWGELFSVPLYPPQIHMNQPGREPGPPQWEAATNSLSYGMGTACVTVGLSVALLKTSRVYNFITVDLLRKKGGIFLSNSATLSIFLSYLCYSLSFHPLQHPGISSYSL
jgi:hypothetical protein